VYQAENLRAVVSAARSRSRAAALPTVSRTVLLLGLTSLFTDISSEMVATILPLYLVFRLGFTPLEFGVIDGLYQGVAALVRVASGVIGDRWRRHKDVAFAGYALSAICKPLFLVVGAAWSGLVAVILFDRTGKGIRTAPRDALISLSTPSAELGTAFGVHRALDTAGAMIGPLLAFALLELRPDHYNPIFVISFCFAIVGVSILGLFVRKESQPEEPAHDEEHVSFRGIGSLLVEPRYLLVVLAGSALALATVSDGFLYLGLQRRLQFDPSYLPLLYVGAAAVFMVLAVPMGRLADRYGRAPVFVVGYTLLLVVYALLLFPAFGGPQLVLYLVLVGAYYAATDGVLMALASAVIPSHLRGSGLSALVTATSVGRLVSSIVFGAIWATYSAGAAVVVFGILLSAALLAATLLLRRTPRRALA
jgi:MFS family permease